MCFHRRRIPKHLLLEPPAPPMGFGRVLKWFFILLLAVLASLLTAVARASLSGQSPTSLTQTQAGQLLFKNSQGGLTAALHQESEAHVTIKGLVAKVILRQRFINTGAEWAEGIYVFPLGETAAVSRMLMTIGERRLLGEIKEKEEARHLYDQARIGGRRAALTEQERPNLFTQSVANIGPGETVMIELHFHETVSYRDNTFRWRLPMTLTPRYIPGTPTQDEDRRGIQAKGWALPTDQVPDAHRISPFIHDGKLPGGSESPKGMINPIRIHLRLDAGLPLANIRGSYHTLRLHKSGDIHRIVTTPETIPMDRDFEITWQTIAGKSPDAALFVEEVAGDDYALLMLLPPQKHSDQTLPREVIFVIDTSGSMSGTAIVQAKTSLLLALSRLRSEDRFNLIEFNSHHQSLFTEAQMAGAWQRERAADFVKGLQARGGTEMADALTAALKDEALPGYLKQVVFITDGSVGNESALFKLIHEQLRGARLFTVGIGSAPNSFFMRKAAEFGRGSFTFIGSEQEIEEKMGLLFKKLESPLLSDLRVQWPQGIQAEVWPAQLPDLYQGEPLVIKVKFAGNLPPGARIRVSGRSAQDTWQREITYAPAATANTAGVAVSWARAKIEALLDEKIRGRSETEVRAEVLPLALQHQLLSPYTSFVAVEETLARPQGESLTSFPLANLLPQGQVLREIGYPQTATSAILQILGGLLAFFGLLLLRYLARRSHPRYQGHYERS